MEPPPPHFLVVTFPAQGHLNPALHLAKRLASSTDARVTFSTGIAAHRRMFPSISSDSQVIDGGITYIPFSDGSSSSAHNPNVDGDLRSFVSGIKHLGSPHLASILRELNISGHPVTCVIYTIMLQWAGDVAFDLGIPTALYWIQAATVLCIYHHFFNGLEPLIAAHGKDLSFPIAFPSLPVFQIRDLPTFLTITTPDEPFFDILLSLRHVFEALSRRRRAGEKPAVLVNSFDELEPEALASMAEHMDLVTVGPVMPGEAESATADMFDQNEKEYMEWLDEQEEGSVVYAAFGSVHKLSRDEIEEIGKGLRESQRPYLWVVRKDSRFEGMELEQGKKKKKQGMVVEWCSQLKVLAHSAVGCFVTHGGWNSTVEGLVLGVPAVAMPKWSDQGTNAWLMERVWGTAVRAEEGGDGKVSAGELRRCLEIVMGEGERGAEIRRRAEMWKEKARKAIGDHGGWSGRNLKAFCSRRK
ncbi:UDP-glycosyltransferase 75B1 [Platanthera guangdongensis]|uniref:Glycosyltransferase n=1 Tax=Platanthera guangdongensis TaxID=2320717 RepID=A0ABR2MFC4_9ASPA